MLDQRLIRENPTLVEEKLTLRGKKVDITDLHQLTLDFKKVDIELAELQSKSKKLSKEIGVFFKNLSESGNQNMMI